jgi:hypothetical protein
LRGPFGGHGKALLRCGHGLRLSHNRGDGKGKSYSNAPFVRSFRAFFTTD